MYSLRVTEAEIGAECDRLGCRTIPRDSSECFAIREHLEKWWNDGSPQRPLQQWEKEFIRSEQILSKHDFRYWCPRYCFIQLDGGGVGPLVFAESQRVVLDLYLAPAEEENWQKLKERVNPSLCEGLLFYWHKARQLYATAMVRALLMHRQSFHHNFRNLASSVDDSMIQELYDRDKLIWDRMPFYLKPKPNREKDYDVKAEHFYISALNNRILYSSSTAKTGMGQGRQFDGHHLTECAFFVNPVHDIDYVLAPAIPKSPSTMGFRESTANFRGDWWHETTENARRGLDPRFRYIFMPWYIVETKYVSNAPDSWAPSEMTARHAELVERTSPEWTGGRTVHLSRQQMYWYEMNRADAQRKHKLNLFLTNYCATPEESFQHRESSAFSAELMEELRLRAAIAPVPYEVQVSL